MMYLWEILDIFHDVNRGTTLIPPMTIASEFVRHTLRRQYSAINTYRGVGKKLCGQV